MPCSVTLRRRQAAQHNGILWMTLFLRHFLLMNTVMCFETTRQDFKDLGNASTSLHL